MKDELDKKLCADYPEIFRDRHGSMRDTAMCWGFECGDGWYPLIDQLCRNLMGPVTQARDRVRQMKKELAVTDRSKWSPWMVGYYTPEKLSDAEAHLANELTKIPVAAQVKEKFGGLRFYVNGATDEQWAKIHFAESLSHRICEVCGTMEGAMTYGIGWHQTLCPTHADESYGPEAAAHFRNKTGVWSDEQD